MARIIPIPIGPIFPGGPCRGIIHVIQKGDTLYQLGKRYHVSVGQLMFANPFVDVYNLQIGDELCIPATIQPRTIGAKERLEYQDIDHWAERDQPESQDGWDQPDGDDWEGQSKNDSREDWSDRENYQGDGWEEQSENDDREDWSDREKDDSQDWSDYQKQEDQDWDDHGGKESWEEHDRHNWKNSDGWHANYDWKANR